MLVENSLCFRHFSLNATSIRGFSVKLVAFSEKWRFFCHFPQLGRATNPRERLSLGKSNGPPSNHTFAHKINRSLKNPLVDRPAEPPFFSFQIFRT